MKAPVIIFVYKRYNHTKKTIEALSNNILAKETEVFVYSDGPKNENSINEVEKIREYLEHIKKQNYFKSFTVTCAQKNKGLAKSVISGTSEVIKLYGKVIVLEDDLISTPNFLTYMNDALDYYKYKEQVWSISGYSFNLKIPDYYCEDVYFANRGGSWGWGTWIDRWNTVDWKVKDYELFKNNKKLRRLFNIGGRDMSDMLDLQMQGKIDSWAIRWGYEQFKQRKMTVYPVKSKIKNIGLDGSGTHSGSTSRFDVILDMDELNDCKFVEPFIDRTIIKNFRNYYAPPTKFYLSKIISNFNKLKNVKKC